MQKLNGEHAYKMALCDYFLGSFMYQGSNTQWLQKTTSNFPKLFPTTTALTSNHRG